MSGGDQGSKFPFHSDVIQSRDGRKKRKKQKRKKMDFKEIRTYTTSIDRKVVLQFFC